MRKGTNLIFAAVFAGLMVIGAVQGGRVHHIRDSESFYRWIQSVAADIFFNEEVPSANKSDEYSDYSLFAQVIDTTEPLLPDLPLEEEEGFDKHGQPFPRIVSMVRNGTYDDIVWDLVQGTALEAERAAFQDYLQAQELEFTSGIDVAQAQASGVNLFNLFFGFRTVAANFVWLQVDKYWHMGMMHRMLPLMKTTVALDPHFIDAYLVGAWHLAYNATAKLTETPAHLKRWSPKYEACLGEKEMYYYLGIDYLKDGIRNNPRNYKLYFDIGFAIYKNKLSDFENAVKYLGVATRLPHERWVPRQLYICMEANKDYAGALAGWENYAQRFPENAVAPRFILRNKGLLAEQEGNRLFEEAAAAKEPAQAEQLKARAAQAEQRAREIYIEMNESFSLARVFRMDAVKLAQEKRYLEAMAILEHARWECLSFFDEFSELIMDYKAQAGVPLSVSEQKAVMRKQEGDRCIGMPDDA